VTAESEPSHRETHQGAVSPHASGHQDAGHGWGEVLRRSKEMRPDLPVVMMTAYATVETAVEAMKIGAMDYLMKPFNPDTLVPLVVQLFQKIEGPGEKAPGGCRGVRRRLWSLHPPQVKTPTATASFPTWSPASSLKDHQRHGATRADGSGQRWQRAPQNRVAPMRGLPRTPGQCGLLLLHLPACLRSRKHSSLRRRATVP